MLSIGLGSILAISDSQGNLVERRQFGACLSRYNAMKAGNGRLYDAKLGRFLSPDNFVQDPYNTQSFNRYGYVVNNPLSFSDESGEFIWFAVAIGALINMTTAAIQGKSIGQVLLAGAIGAAAGIIGGGFANLAVGGAFFGNAAAGVIGFGQGFLAGAVGGFAGGFVGGAGNAWMNGASFGDGLGAGFKTGLIGGATGGLMGGISGGIRANKMGADFWSGKKIASNISKPLSNYHILDHRAPDSNINPVKAVNSPEIPSRYVDSSLNFDGDSLEMVRNYNDGSTKLIDSWDAVSGNRGLGANVTNGRIPNGTWDLTNMNLNQGGSGYTLNNVEFYGDLEPRFNLIGRGGFEIHPDGGIYGITNGCIGLHGTSDQLMNFYNLSSNYIERYGALRLVVNY